MIEQIRPAQMADWLQTHAERQPLVLDVREPWEIQTASLPAVAGWDLITIPMGVLPARLHEFDKTRPVACLCHLGGRSMQVAMYLQHQGFATVANIAGGIHAWSLEYDPSVPVY